MTTRLSTVFLLIISCNEGILSESILSGSGTGTGNHIESTETSQITTSNSYTLDTYFETSGTGGMSGSGGTNLCGNGVIDANEECDDEEKCYNCLTDRLIFVTSLTRNGNMGGILNADLLCNQLVLNPNNPWITPEDFINQKREMRAWLSDFTGPIDRFNLAKGRYVRVDNKVVVEKGIDLLDSNLINPINIDEKGQIVENYVWTNTSNEGVPYSELNSCENWMTSSAFLNSTVGWSNSVDSNWIFSNSGVNPQLCAFDYHIYCVEADQE